MKTIKNIFMLMAFVFTMASCKEAITIDIPTGEKKVVVEAEVTTEMDSSYVKLTMSADYYSADPYPVIDNANVSVNGIIFNNMGKGIYKAPSPYVGVRGQTYNLNIVYNGNTYTSKALLEPMFRIDSVFQVFKPKSGFLKEGYSINYLGFDDRPKIKYTYFRLGYFDTIVHRDSLSENKILFNSNQTPIGVEYAFELPFTRFQIGEEAILIFRSIDKNMNDFISAYNTQTSGAPGPFQSPPANLPSNIVGTGVVGYFATYDVVRRRYTVK
jgi:hypothetical protein